MIPPEQRPSQSRASVRIDACLDAATRATVDDLAHHFHQPRAAVVCAIMHWGLHHPPIETPDQGHGQGPVRHLHLHVDADLHARAERAARAAGLKLAPWPRQMVRRITMPDFPASWQAERVEQRSHDSRRYGTHFMLRLDVPLETKLQHLATQFGASKADIIRQLIRHATPDDFPKSWHLRAVERAAPARRPQTGNSREITP
jgi:hypothetical protein